MINLTDSHCHLNILDLAALGVNLSDIISQAKKNNVNRFLTVGVLLSEYSALQAIAEQFEEVYFSMGVHPDEAPDLIISEQDFVDKIKHPKLVAIGETGLDYFRLTGDLTWQRNRFITHIDIAKKYQKPLIIHTRAAQADTIAIMQSENAGKVGGVMHCFTESWEMAKASLDLGFYISISGIVTFKTAEQIREVAKKMPVDRLLVETDSPYLAPVPHRGKSNVPAYVRHTAEFIAELRGETLEYIAEKTTENFNRLFLVK